MCVEPREQQLVSGREQMRLMENELVANQRRMQQLEGQLNERAARLEVMTREIATLRYVLSYCLAAMLTS